MTVKTRCDATCGLRFQLVIESCLARGDGAGISIVWNDNHATWEDLANARKLIHEQTGKTLEEWSGLAER